MNQIKKASEFFSSRRSVSVRNLKYPGPTEKQIMDILKSALRVPDHGKLEPLLTAALQEAITEIETLKTKVAALEGS